MSDLDSEARAARFIDAVDCIHDLLSGRAPGLPLDAEPLAQMFGLISEEARHVVPSHAPRHAKPANDQHHDDDRDRDHPEH